MKHGRTQEEARADEILMWLAECGRPPTSWVVLDDMDLHGFGLGDHFVQVDERYGLVDADVESATRVLREQADVMRTTMFPGPEAIRDVSEPDA